MTGVRRRWRERSGRLAGAAVPAVLALALAACGTVPPQTTPATGAAPPPGATHSSTTAPGTLGSSPTPSTSVRPTTAPTPARPTNAPPTPPPDTWVGHFEGHAVWVPRGHGAHVSFTFDDGPWPGSTSAVLELLAQHHVHAVFCLIGNQAKVNPTLVRREVAGGHELCNHSRDHDLTMDGKGKKYVEAEVADGLADIRRAAPRGTEVRFYRQPGGLWDADVVKAMDQHSLDPLRWSDDPRDWSRPGSAAIVRRVVSHLHPGVVILMHDGGGDRSQTVAALRFLLGAVVAAGWTPVLAPHVALSAKAAAKPQ
ncbi:MAG TPA: polysaccharide deacetylase family protein [Friedmanniella sp.]